MIWNIPTTTIVGGKRFGMKWRGKFYIMPTTSSDDQENYKNEQLSSEDEFEKSLVSEVLSTLRKVTPSPPGKTNKEEGRVPVLPKDQAGIIISRRRRVAIYLVHFSPGTSDQYYDEVYFDSSGSSDEEEDVRVGRNDPSGERGDKKKKHPRKVKKLTNDELFYDPEMDKEDERWVRRKCMSYYNGEQALKWVKGYLDG